MELGSISMWGPDLEAFRAEVRAAEELGFGLITVGDSPAGWHELYVSLTVAGLETRRATIAPMVTIPISRHPVVAASAMNSLYDLTGGRAAFAIGTGGSAVTGMGREAATQAQAKAYMIAMRQLFNGEEAAWETGTMTELTMDVFYTVQGTEHDLRLTTLASETLTEAQQSR